MMTKPSKKGMKPLSGSETLPKPNFQEQKHCASPSPIQTKLSQRSCFSIRSYVSVFRV